MYNQDPSPEGDDVEGLVAAAHFWVYGSLLIVFIVTSENVEPPQTTKYIFWNQVSSDCMDNFKISPGFEFRWIHLQCFLM